MARRKKTKNKYEGREAEIQEAGVHLLQLLSDREDIIMPEIVGLLGASAIGMWSVQLAQLGPRYKKAADLFTPEKILGVIAAAYRLGIIFGRGVDEKEALEELDEITRVLD